MEIPRSNNIGAFDTCTTTKSHYKRTCDLKRISTLGKHLHIKIRLTLCIVYGPQEPVLRVTQHLPDILYLQKLLFDHFHQRIDQIDALEMSIEEYLMTLQSGTMPNILNKLFYSVFFDR